MEALMGIFSWDDSYSINNEMIDKQHRVLVELIDELLTSAKQQEAGADVSKILTELEKYTVEHFTYEENLLEEHGYSDLVDHKNNHREFVAQIQDFQIQVKENQDSNITSKLGMYLMEWLRDHIKITDKQFMDFLNSKGVY